MAACAHTPPHTCFSEKRETQLILKIYRCEVCCGLGFFFPTSFAECLPQQVLILRLEIHILCKDSGFDGFIYM